MMKTKRIVLLSVFGLICCCLAMPGGVYAKSRVISAATLRNQNKPVDKGNITKKISVNFRNKDIRKIFKKLEPFCGNKYVLDQKIQGNVSLKVKRTSCENIVEILMAENKLKAANEGDYIRVFPVTEIEPEIKKQPEIKKKPVTHSTNEGEINPAHVKTQKKRGTSAFHNKFYIGFSGAYSLQFLDDQQTKDKFTGDVNVSFDNSFGFQFKGGYMFNSYLSSEAVVNFLFPYEASLDNGNDDLSVINFSINGKGSYPISPMFKPYGVAGVGYLNAYEDISYNGETFQTNDWGVSLRLGTGVDMAVTPDVSIGFETIYCTGLGNVDHISYLTLSLGLTYTF